MQRQKEAWACRNVHAMIIVDDNDVEKGRLYIISSSSPIAWSQTIAQSKAMENEQTNEQMALSKLHDELNPFFSFRVACLIEEREWESKRASKERERKRWREREGENSAVKKISSGNWISIVHVSMPIHLFGQRDSTRESKQTTTQSHRSLPIVFQLFALFGYLLDSWNWSWTFWDESAKSIHLVHDIIG